MSISQETRSAVRAAYAFRCGYCGLPETLAGSALEMDHFRPLRHGGTDSEDNLVYACTTCNRFKGDYWPSSDAPNDFVLLHPRQNNVSAHIMLTSDGSVVGLTPRGWFHLRWLHLNRPQLVELRRNLMTEQGLRTSLAQSEKAQGELRQRVAELEAELAQLQSFIAQLISP